jgi:hypothetical protein
VSAPHGDIRGFVVANFADHHDVRVLAKNGAQRVGEVEADFRLHRDLIHTGQLVADWAQR